MFHFVKFSWRFNLHEALCAAGPQTGYHWTTSCPLSFLTEEARTEGWRRLLWPRPGHNCTGSACWAVVTSRGQRPGLSSVSSHHVLVIIQQIQPLSLLTILCLPSQWENLPPSPPSLYPPLLRPEAPAARALVRECLSADLKTGFPPPRALSRRPTLLYRLSDSQISHQQFSWIFQCSPAITFDLGHIYLQIPDTKWNIPITN